MVGQLKIKSSEVLDSQFLRITKTKPTTIPLPTIESLPKDLLIEVLAKVAASSSTNLFTAKLVTKDFLQASEDGYIFRHISLRNFQKVPWKNSAKFWSFMENCNNNGNPEALYRKGMLEFFTHCKEASGMANLKASAEKDHIEACYVYGVVLYTSSLKGEGVKFLKKCEAKLGIKMFECRQRVRDFFRYIWVINKISLLDSDHQISCDCIKYNQRRNGWDWKDEDDPYGPHTCEACKWNREVLRFCNMLRTGSYD